MRAHLIIGYEDRFDGRVTHVRFLIAQAAAFAPDAIYVEAMNPVWLSFGNNSTAAWPE